MAKKKKKKKRKRTNYVRGREVEYKCKAALVKEGYRIMRASSSKGDFDVIGYNEEGTRYIQLKREMKRQGSYPSVREEIRKIKVPLFLTGMFNGAEVTIPLPNTKELWIWTDKLGWSQWTIRQDGEDEHIDLRRGAGKANKR
jgi:Holliday junction resolvase